MKIASLIDGGRDGRLVVVNKSLTHALEVPDISPTLQQALERWEEVAPELESRYRMLNRESVPDAFSLCISDLASPLPRSHQFLDGSVYLYHMEKARRARGATMPQNYETEPLMYQGLSDRFYGPNEPVFFPQENLEIDYEAEIAIIVDDVPMGVSLEQAPNHIKLILLLNDFTARALTRSELPKGFGFLQSKPSSSFSPVAVTPEELGKHWDGEKLSLPISSYVNSQKIGAPNTGIDAFFSFPDLIVHAARTRSLSAGTIIGSGAVSNQSEDSGYSCIAEARVEEQLKTGNPVTSFLKFGDVVKIEMLDAEGETIFGAIEQAIVQSKN